MLMTGFTLTGLTGFTGFGGGTGMALLPLGYGTATTPVMASERMKMESVSCIMKM